MGPFYEYVDMSYNTSLKSDDVRAEAERIAKDVHDYYFTDEESSFSPRNINNIIATFSHDDSGPTTEVEGSITTTQHNEKVILDWHTSRQHYEFQSFVIELNQLALSVEQLDEVERVQKIAQWIINMSRKVRDEAEQVAEKKAGFQ